MTTRLDGAAPEVEISRDMIRRGLIVAPLMIAICGVIWGGDGVWSSAYGIALVLVNFAIAAALIAVTARDLARADDGRHPVRLPRSASACCCSRSCSSRTPAGFRARRSASPSSSPTSGLLVWELKYVAASLAYPGLKPNYLRRQSDQTERNQLCSDSNFPRSTRSCAGRTSSRTFNKVALIAVLAALIGIDDLPARRPQGPDGGARRASATSPRSSVEFIEDGIVMQTMGKDGLGWTPFLLSLFIFIYLCNVPGIIPIFQMPATARIAIPMFLSLLVWVTFIGVGLKHQRLALLRPPAVAARCARRAEATRGHRSSSSRPSSSGRSR